MPPAPSASPLRCRRARTACIRCVKKSGYQAALTQARKITQREVIEKGSMQEG